MNVIWKYQVPTGGGLVEMPANAKILTVQMQHGFPVIWAEVDPDEKGHEWRHILIVGTGHKFDHPDRTYLGTFQMDSGTFVFHVYEIN